MRGLRSWLAAASLALAADPAWGTADPVVARRMLGLLRAVAQDYAEAFDGAGMLVRPAELEEARLLLAEAREQARGLGGGAPPDLERRLAALAGGLEARAPAAALARSVRELLEALRTASGVTDDGLPPALPAPARGGDLFRAHCASCHGEDGAGRGPDAQRLEPKPSDFTDLAFMRREAPADFFLAISLGRRQAAMPAWEDVLSVQDRWDLVGHLWSLGSTPRALAEGRRAFIDHCQTCHALDAGGAPTSLPMLAALRRLAARSDADLHRAVTDGIPGLSGHAFRELADDERWQAVTFLRSLSLGLGDAASDVEMIGALGRVRRGVEEAVAASRLGEAGAADRVTDAYLVFEPLEPRLAARDPAVVRRVEAEFDRLRRALRQERREDVEQAAVAVRRALEGAAATVERRAGPPVRGRGLAAILGVGVLVWAVSPLGRRAMGRMVGALGRRH